MRSLIFITSIVLLSIHSISAQNFWQQTNGPYNGATVNDFLSYNDSTIFLATEEGLIKSTDNGISWTRLSSNNVTCLGVDKLNTLYFGFSGHLKRSSDGGNSWTDIPIPAVIRDFVIPYTDTIFVGTWDKGMYRSFDRGTNWIQINNEIQQTAIYEIILLSNGYLFVGTNGGGAYKSTNWGDSWATSGNFVRVESFCETSPENLFAGASTGIYYSSNYGTNWTHRGTGIPNNNTAKCIVEDLNGTLYAGIDFSKGVYYLTNNSIQWQHLGLGHSIYTIGWDCNLRLYAGGSGDGLYRFVDEDSSWIHVYNQGYTFVEVDNLWVTDGGNIIAATPWWGLQYTTDSGESWKRLHAPATFYDMASINDSIFIGSGSGAAYLSNDTGKTWIATGPFRSYASFYEPINQIIYLGGHDEINAIWGIYTSSDFGQSWSLLAEFPKIAYVQTVLDIYITRSQQVILTTFRYTFYPNGQFSRFYKSTDHGETWELILENQIDYITHIIEDAYSNLYALVDTKLLVSEDEGKTWITRTIPGSDIIASDHSGRIYRNAGIGVQYSTDKGITWISVDNSGLNNWVNEMAMNQNNRIYLATTSGVYFGEADSIVVSVENNELIKSFYLSQNYPNPFNPSTKIKYEIPDQSAVGGRNDSRLVTLKVFDVLGNEIATLVNEEKQPGTYEVEFNTTSHSGEVRNLVSGIYFYQLRAGDFVETKKMVLIK